MWWPIVIIILLCYYYLFVKTTTENIKKPSIPEPKPQPFSYTFTCNKNDGKCEFRTSRGGDWQFELDDIYYFHQGKISKKNKCFGKPSGSHIKAQGKALYRYIQREQLNPSKGGQFKIHVEGALQNGHIFYFQCKNDRIDSLSSCPPGQIFDKNKCVPINPCLNQPDGTLFPDAFDRQFYYLCPEGRLKCPEGTFFIIDSCRSKSSLENICLNDPKFKFSINLSTYVSCVQGKPQVFTCPPGHVFSDNNCIPDTCLGQPDGSKIPFPKEKFGPFLFSAGYYTCKNNKIHEKIECSNTWDKYKAKDNLTFLPLVFYKGKCSIPEFCKGVTSDDPDVVVPSYKFTKQIKNWKNSLLFDRAVGFKCFMGQRIKVNAPPGQHIFNFKFVSACDTLGKRVVLENERNSYFDCDQQTIISCPPNSFFDGNECKLEIPNAHKFDNMDIFKLDNLEFNWIKPWTYSKDTNVQHTCQDPESVYIYGYNICSHPDCQKFPFLKQLKASIQLDEWSKCTFRHGKISKVKTHRRRHFNFWTQRKSIENEPCIPGSRIKSGHFLLDSVLFSTCKSTQPFVFCPSASTNHVTEIENVFACVPNNEVFESTLKGNTTKLFLDNHLARIIPSPGARVKINGISQPNNPNGIDIDNKEVVIWSDKDLRLQFKMMVNYPPHTYFVNKQLNAYKDENKIFLTRYSGGSTIHPIDFSIYDVEDSVNGFKSDAT